VLASYGLKAPWKDLFCKEGRKWLKVQQFRVLHREEVDGYLEIIDLLMKQMAEVDMRIKSRFIGKQNEQSVIVDSTPLLQRAFGSGGDRRG